MNTYIINITTDSNQAEDRIIDKITINNKKKETEMKPFRLLTKKSTETLIPCKGIHQIGVSFAAYRLGECTTSLQVRSCKYCTLSIL